MVAVAKYWLFISANIYATLICILNGLDLMKTTIMPTQKYCMEKNRYYRK